jgi:outer membrane protein TolC
MTELLEISVKRDEAIATRIRHGDSARIDQVDNHRSVLQRQSSVISSERAFQKASFELSLYYRDQNGNPIITKLDDLPQSFPTENLEDLIHKVESKKGEILNRAIAHPESRKLLFQANQLQTEYDLARNQILPKLDFQFGVFSDLGLNAGANYLPPSTYPTEMRVAFTLEFPLLFRSARGKANSSLLSINKLETYQQLTRNKLEIQMNDSVQSMNASFQRLKLAHQEVQLARKLEESERLRAEHGDSSILIVNIREQNTRDAMSKEIDAYSDFYKALAEFEASSAVFFL